MDIIKYEKGAKAISISDSTELSTVSILNEFNVSNYTSVEGKAMYLKIVSLLTYLVNDYEKFQEDYSKLVNVIEQRKDEIPEGDFEIISNMLGRMAMYSVQIQDMIHKDKQQLVLKRVEKEIQEAAALQPKYLAEGEREKRFQLVEKGKQWAKQEGLSVVLAAAGAAGVGVAGFKVTNLTQIINGALVGTGMWLKTPFGMFCKNITEEVTKTGWFGQYNETVQIRPDNIMCNLTDSLSSGLTSLANSAEDLRIGALILLTTMAFFFFMFTYRLMVAKYKVSGIGFSLKKD